jgi:hypothetical protein
MHGAADLLATLILVGIALGLVTSWFEGRSRQRIWDKMWKARDLAEEARGRREEPPAPPDQPSPAGYIRGVKVQ